jgi:hypothetical protein
LDFREEDDAQGINFREASQGYSTLKQEIALMKSFRERRK